MIQLYPAQDSEKLELNSPAYLQESSELVQSEEPCHL